MEGLVAFISKIGLSHQRLVRVIPCPKTSWFTTCDGLMFSAQLYYIYFQKLILAEIHIRSTCHKKNELLILAE